MNKKIILAYSGGLDTSVMLKWLVNKGYEVIAYIADVGQKEDFQKIKEKALATGASKVYIEDLKEELVKNYIFELIKTGAKYQGKYLLGTAIARPIIAKKQVEIALKEKTNILAHGCTGKGNDQVRFELVWMQYMPNVQIISPWKDPEWLDAFNGRIDLINYAKKEKIPISVSKAKPYSTDENLMHISYEAGILEDPNTEPIPEMFKFTNSPQSAPDKEIKICIEFKCGKPIKLIDFTNKKEITKPLELFTYLNKIAGICGIGRIDIVEDRFIGIKSRGVYETPAGTILYDAHKDLESIVLDKAVIHLKEILKPIIAKLIYDGMWFSPEMDFLTAAINKSQEKVNGAVNLSLYKGNVIIKGRKSINSIYDQALSSMDEDGGFDQKDSEGFIKIIGTRLKLQGAEL
jgi:argininosuccinate synthase